MKIVSGSQAELSPILYDDLGCYRHQVFVELLQWDLNTPEGIEQDQFDRQDTVYVLARNDEGRINGCARLLPTTKPYLLGEVFPELFNGLTPPSSSEVWELSRFAAVDTSDMSASPRGQLSSPIAVALLRHTIETAARLGAKRLITVSPVGVERLLRHAGFRAHRAGPPMVIGGHPLFACWIEVEQTS
ncbi:acyl-homoserine-lactone synthase [Fluviibacter phosphoraccumulans]|uniref:acyl-homoserine-lactone synthase n=1 Tax=Fluviibacter phosphoraccumulans TaxID=1751046 RepID=UPI0010B46A8E|nr:acyl-homoserine-lactone synthase [Fluviibacter phosphoraccumulans]BCA64676.1 acyl-homoserine-lactone synthase [Fluviibacter phosphoraccumulans]